MSLMPWRLDDLSNNSTHKDLAIQDLSDDFD